MNPLSPVVGRLSLFEYDDATDEPFVVTGKQL